jgi:hypothetical protein
MGQRTTSASASLTRRRSTASSTRQPIQSKSAIRPSQAGGFRSSSVTQEWLILNHARNTVITAITLGYPLTVLTRPTPIQQEAFDPLGIKCGQ